MLPFVVAGFSRYRDPMPTPVIAVSQVSADRLLLSLAVVVAAAWAGGRLLRRLGQPAVLGEIIAGILLGPSLLGVLWPSASEALFPPEVVSGLRVIAEVGLVLFMFLVGVEVDVAGLRGKGRATFVISQASIIVPVVLGVALSPLLRSAFVPDSPQPGFSLFVGAAMGITAFPVLARLLQQLELDTVPAGIVAIACAAVNDVAAWCILAVAVAVVTAGGHGDLVVMVLAAGVFVVVVLGVLRPLLAGLASLPLALAVALALAGAWVTDAIGVHAIFGAFLVGVAMPRSGGVAEEVIGRLESMTTVILLPVFFVVAGLEVRLQDLGSAVAMAMTVLITVVAVLGKVGGTVAGARVVGMRWSDAVGVGLLMNTRGLTEIVILSVGLQLGVIDGELYTAMVVMALVTTFMAAPILERTGLARRWRTQTSAG